MTRSLRNKQKSQPASASSSLLSLVSSDLLLFPPFEWLLLDRRNRMSCLQIYKRNIKQLTPKIRVAVQLLSFVFQCLFLCIAAIEKLSTAADLTSGWHEENPIGSGDEQIRVFTLEADDSGIKPVSVQLFRCSFSFVLSS